MELLKKDEISNIKRKYRILHDSINNESYVRAIVSTGRYHNYDDNIAIVIALVSLHKRMKESGVSYSLNRVEYNESHIKIFFESSEREKLENIGYIKNLIVVSNDEIKRESLKFEAICSIIFNDINNQSDELLIYPPSSNKNNIKTSILSVQHNLSPKNFIKSLMGIDYSTKIHSELSVLIHQISKIKDMSQIKCLIEKKVQRARNQNFRQHKVAIEELIDKSVTNNIIQLLTLFRKMELLTGDDIEANEYVRYLVYQCLIEPKGKMKLSGKKMD